MVWRSTWQRPHPKQLCITVRGSNGQCEPGTTPTRYIRTVFDAQLRGWVDSIVYRLQDPLYPECQRDNVLIPEHIGRDDRDIIDKGDEARDNALYRHFAETCRHNWLR